MPAPEQCTIRSYLIDPHKIHHLRFIIEAYPGIGVVSTIDQALGLVVIAVAPGCESEIDDIIEFESENLNLRPVVPQG